MLPAYHNTTNVAYNYNAKVPMRNFRWQLSVFKSSHLPTWEAKPLTVLYFLSSCFQVWPRVKSEKVETIVGLLRFGAANLVENAASTCGRGLRDASYRYRRFFYYSTAKTTIFTSLQVEIRSLSCLCQYVHRPIRKAGPRAAIAVTVMTVGEHSACQRTPFLFSVNFTWGTHM